MVSLPQDRPLVKPYRPSALTEECLQALIDRNGLAVHFGLVGDRYEQRIYAVIDGVQELIVQSVEDANGPNESISPAFQDLSRQTIGEGALVFLVGLSHGAYWSTSVEVLPSGRGFQWDVSCKPSRDETLIMAFKASHAPRMLNDQTAVISLKHPWECTIECEAVSAQETRLAFEDQMLTVRTRPLSTRAKAAVRWKFRMDFKEVAISRDDLASESLIS